MILCQSSASESRPHCLEVYIADSGYGIPREDLEKVFQGKYRGVQENSDIPGTGLGLSIVKDLLQRMEGRIQAFSPAISSPFNEKEHGLQSSEYPGSTFLITFFSKN